MIKRREFIAGLGGLVAWPFTAHAQQDGRRRRIGVLSGNAEDDPEGQAQLATFRQGLERLGWSEGRNVRIDYRFAAASPGQFQAFAKELLALQPDVIYATTTPAAAALQRESRMVPIVFTGVHSAGHWIIGAAQSRFQRWQLYRRGGDHPLHQLTRG